MSTVVSRMTQRILTFALALLGVASWADEVQLKGGGRIVGSIVERTPQLVTIDVGAGRVSVPANRVESVQPGRSALTAFNDRAARLAPTDTQGWLNLALWARDQGLATQARRAFERVVALDPANTVAQTALGNVLVGERWVSQEEAYRQQGYVQFEGSWMTPAERDGRIAAARAEVEMEQGRIEADARAREAEARAREAEARAREAESGPSEGGLEVGIPWYGRPGVGHRRHRDRDDQDGRRGARRPSQPDPQPTPEPPPKPHRGGPRSISTPAGQPKALPVPPVPVPDKH